MLFQEEYLKRHKIVLPEVHHTLTSGSLILKSDPNQFGLGSRWALLTLDWKENPHHPGAYEVKFRVPVHDGCTKRDLWETVPGYPPALTLQYEEIEVFFEDLVTAHGKLTPVCEHSEIGLATWEIFLYTHDEWIVKNASSKLQDLIGASIDFDSPIKDRLIAYTEAVNCLMVEQPHAFERYNQCIHAFTKRSLGWLARLVNGG